MVFIRPTIVRSPLEAQRIAGPRYEYMRNSEVRDPGQEAMLDAMVRDYLRTAPPVTPPPGAIEPAPLPVPATPPAAPGAVGPDDRSP